MKERVLDAIPEDTIKNLTSVQEFSYCSFENCFSSLGRRKGLIHVFLSNRVRNTEPLEIAIKQAKSNLKLSEIKLFKVISIDQNKRIFTTIDSSNNQTTFKFHEFQNQEIVNLLKVDSLIEINRGSESTHIGGRRYYSVIELV